MATIPINFQVTFEQPFVEGLLVLEGRQFIVRIHHSSRRVGNEGLEPPDANNPERQRRALATFRMNWFSSAGVKLISGLRLRLGNDLLKLFKHNKEVPQGSLNLVAFSELGFEPTRGIPAPFTGDNGVDLGKRIVFRYVESDVVTYPIIPIAINV